jgi:hypothetical protein
MSADAVEYKDYLLTVRVKITAMDDAEARGEALIALDDLHLYNKGEIETKLQRLNKSAAPEKVEL